MPKYERGKQVSDLGQDGGLTEPRQPSKLQRFGYKLGIIQEDPSETYRRSLDEYLSREARKLAAATPPAPKGRVAGPDTVGQITPFAPTPRPLPAPTLTPVPRVSAAPTPYPRPTPTIDLDSFMNAISTQESGGNYGAKNSRTGASGRYQILPSNWPSWSQEAGLPKNAAQTPQNQERVARFKIQQYYNKYGNWEDVASAWYSGRPLNQVGNRHVKQGRGNEPSVQDYVNSVTNRARKGKR